MYARKLQAEMEIAGERRPVPLDWLDSFCMRNFTGSGEFDDTLSTAEGRLEAGLSVDPNRLAAAMSEWFTKRGKGNGQAVTVVLRPSGLRIALRSRGAGPACDDWGVAAVTAASPAHLIALTLQPRDR